MSEQLTSAIVEECSPHTMLPRSRLTEMITFMMEVAGSADFPSGSVVECGTWKGGMALAATRVFGTARRYAFYDSFAGLPSPGSRDGEDAHWWAAHPEHPRYFNNCRAGMGEMTALFKATRPEHNVVIIKGWFEATLWPAAFAPIAWTHLDCDWYDSTYLCLERLWPYVIEGGVIAIDDYYDWEGCRRAVHDFLSCHSAREAIERIGRHGGVAIRRRGKWRLNESPHLI